VHQKFGHTEAEFNEFERWLKYGWFHLKLYSMFQYLSWRSIETGFWRISDKAQNHQIHEFWNPQQTHTWQKYIGGQKGRIFRFSFFSDFPKNLKRMKFYMEKMLANNKPFLESCEVSQNI